MLVINESGLYSLIFKSRKPQAKSFRKWVTSEVLPAIRKTGTYTAPQTSATSPVEQPTGLDALDCPMTVPEFLSGLLAVRQMPVADMIRFGERCRRLARAFGDHTHGFARRFGHDRFLGTRVLLFFGAALAILGFGVATHDPKRDPWIVTVATIALVISALARWVEFQTPKFTATYARGGSEATKTKAR